MGGPDLKEAQASVEDLHDDRDVSRFHLSGFNLYIIVLALYLSVLLVALVGFPLQARSKIGIS